MYPSMGQQTPAGNPRQRTENPLHQDIERVRTQIAQNEQRHAEMRNGQSDQQDHCPNRVFF